ncbi:RecX family transcriptional regulator [Pseudactinotalea sp. HY158]|uniref:RecX family transcriptional regulator n=1 Tax=Pseudactinotalea sp. HY158 TaxID=2654547 RepID=UPI001E5511CB|nr:RecX family transcriptional regulator [Pseudactinotalea sp. HY158]
MAGTDPAADDPTSAADDPPPAGDLPRDPASAEATADTIAQLRTMLADHAAAASSDLWQASEPAAGTGEAAASPEPASPGSEPAPESVPAGRPAPAGGPVPTGRSAPDPAGEPAAEEERERAREIALQQLSFSARSRHQLAQAMTARDVPEPIVTELLDRFEQVGLIDDAEYAAMLVRTRYRERGLARPALAQELRRKGITGPPADAALDQIDSGDERAAARDLIARRIRSMGEVEPAKRRQRLYALLARRGYAAAVAVSVVDEALAAEGLNRY